MRYLLPLCLIASTACAEDSPPCWAWTQRTVEGVQLVCLRAPPGYYARDGWHMVSEFCEPTAEGVRAKAAERHIRICGE